MHVTRKIFLKQSMLDGNAQRNSRMGEQSRFVMENVPSLVFVRRDDSHTVFSKRSNVFEGESESILGYNKAVSLGASFLPMI